jgi:hypothetical protein
VLRGDRGRHRLQWRLTGEGNTRPPRNTQRP